MSIDLVQGSDAWLFARVGSLGASRVHEAIAKTKSGYGAGRDNLIAELLVERLTGQPAERFVSDAMKHGTECEPEARTAYEFISGNEVTQVGIVPHPTIQKTHASPDGLIGDKGVLEIKSPQSATHISTLLTGRIPAKYVTQMHWQMICTGREFADFVSYDNRMPSDMQLFISRLELDQDYAAELEDGVGKFLAELNAKVEELNIRFRKEAA